MAQAAKAKQNTSLVKNTAGRVDLKGNTSGNKTNASRGKTGAANKSGARKTGTANKSGRKTTSNRQNYARNTAAAQGSSIAGAFVGAFIIQSFKELVKYFLPSVSGVWMMIATGATGVAFGMFGRKIPLIGKYSGVIANAMYLSTAIDVVSEFAFPKLLTVIKSATAGILPANLLPSGTQQVGQTTGEDGQLGYVYKLPGGQLATVYDNRTRNYGGGGGGALASTVYSPGQRLALP